MMLSLVALLPAAALAQTPTLEHREWEFTVFGGASYLNKDTYPTPVLGPAQPVTRNVGLRYATGSEFGARVTENRWKHWAATAEYSFSNQPLTFTNLSDAIPSLSLSQSIHRFSYNILYLPLSRSSRLRPYGFAGPGVSLFYIHESSKTAASALGIRVTDPWKPTFNWGGGVSFLLVDGVAVNAQATDSISGVPRYGFRKAAIDAQQSIPGFSPDGILQNWRFTVGVAFQWGAK